eukprot:scaffold120164_cov66-Phaeocystis_antarctica.AAC.1
MPSSRHKPGVAGQHASAAQAADGPRLAEAPGSLRRGLALKAASGAPAGRRLATLFLSSLAFDMGACATWPRRRACA